MTAPDDARGPALAHGLESGRAEPVLALLSQLETRLRELRPSLEALRREGMGADGPRRRFELTSAALDEIEETLELVRRSRVVLGGVEQRLTRRFDQLLHRLRELDRLL
jgi:hypothetical protein